MGVFGIKIFDGVAQSAIKISLFGPRLVRQVEDIKNYIAMVLIYVLFGKEACVGQAGGNDYVVSPTFEIRNHIIVMSNVGR